MRNRIIPLIIAVALLLGAVLSYTVLAEKTSAPENRAELIASIDDKISTVMKLATTSTLASAGVSAMPGDTASGIAEKLADLSGIFLAILCVLYSEKFLVCYVGIASFRYLLPGALVVLAISMHHRLAGLRSMGIKIAIFALVLFFAIPLSINMADSIYASYQESIDETLVSTEELGNELADVEEEEESSSLWDKITDTITISVDDITDKAASVFNSLLESIAILLVTTCVIPMLGIVVIVWLIKLLFGVNFGPGMAPRMPDFRPHGNPSDGDGANP